MASRKIPEPFSRGAGKNRKPFIYSLSHAFELVEDHGLRFKNMNRKKLEEVLDVQKSTLSDYLNKNQLPIGKLLAFEMACDATYVTQYLASQARLLVVDMPAGRALKQMDVADLQVSFAEATSLLIRFYQGKSDAEETIAAITEVMTGLGWHRANVQKAPAPELDLFGGEE